MTLFSLRDFFVLCTWIVALIIFCPSKAGGKVDKTNLTQVDRAMSQLGIEMIAAYSPQARGRSERMFGALQKRFPQQLRINGITSMEQANQFLQDVYLPHHNARFKVNSKEQDTHLSPGRVQISRTSCVFKSSVRSGTTTRYIPTISAYRFVRTLIVSIM